MPSKPKPAKTNSRKEASKILVSIIQQKGSLDDLLQQAFNEIPENEQAFLQELCYGTLRHYYSLEKEVSRFLKKPFKNKDADVHALLLIGAYQLLYLRTPEYAAINETVKATLLLKKVWAKGVVNAVLRNLLRAQKKNDVAIGSDDIEALYNHPQWLIERIQQYWPNDAAAIFSANNHKAPMTLRVNKNKTTRDDYLALLTEGGISASATTYSPSGIQLKNACDVNDLPDFFSGEVSVQDEAAQLCAELLNVENNHSILDACAAPGGKTGHLLECAPEANLSALEINSRRLEKVEENIARLGLTAQCFCVDASEPNAWPKMLQAEQFDRILLDAPCSAIGVIRRHPDIKLLRRESDIATLSALQLKLLLALWPKLKKGGLLLYATCSILNEENDEVLASFLAKADDAKIEAIKADWGISTHYGRQLLPEQDGHDGFFYSLLTKVDNTNK